jgi:hypothetical protein
LAKRNITDEEIGLIKAMLKKGMRNDEAHFHFNRQDRLLSPGRITQIKSGKYGGSVAVADDSALDRFMDDFEQRSGSSANIADLVTNSIASHFEPDGNGGFRLKGGETDRIECKRTFRVNPENRFAEVVKAIAGMANNKGGMILFGVHDGTSSVEGLADDQFDSTDPAVINRILAGALDPVPHITKSAISLGGKVVGVLTVEPHVNAPVIALKMMGQDVKEGCIYFRYVGETRTIKPGELRQIIAMREQRAVAEFSRRMVGVATGSQATLDMETGEVNGNAGSFLIDKTLLPQIQFIREGDFSEVKGAAALRLVGDVQPIDKEQRKKARVIRDAVTPDAVVRNFLRLEKVAEPLQYLHAQAHCQRKWLPIWYYVREARMPIDDLVEDLRSQVATHPSSRNAVVHRLRRTERAFKIHPGKPALLLDRLLGGEQIEPGNAAENMVLSNAIMGLPDGAAQADSLRSVVLEMLDKTAEGSAVRSAIYRAACRIDEILFCQT